MSVKDPKLKLQFDKLLFFGDAIKLIAIYLYQNGWGAIEVRNMSSNFIISDGDQFPIFHFQWFYWYMKNVFEFLVQEKSFSSERRFNGWFFFFFKPCLLCNSEQKEYQLRLSINIRWLPSKTSWLKKKVYGILSQVTSHNYWSGQTRIILKCFWSGNAIPTLAILIPQNFSPLAN